MTLPEYPPGWHGGATADLSWSALAFNAWWALRLLVAVGEALAANVAAYPWLPVALGAGVLAWRWAPHPWWRLCTVQVVGLLVVLPGQPWVAGAAAGNSVVVGLVGWAWLRIGRPALPAGRE